MLENIRSFSKTVFAKILLVIIIIPFVFWGMGGLFQSGNSNNIAKINNENITAQDFIDYVNRSNVNPEIIRNDIDKNILEELLAEFVSKIMLKMEVEELNLTISDKILNKKIKQNKNFQDENSNFSRTKYEKFLLSLNLPAPLFELRLKDNELKNNLFKYINGGIKSPNFLINKTYKEKNSKILIDFINLENSYKKKDSFTDVDIVEFINENKDFLKEKKISFNYSKVTPKNLIGLNEFNETFFKKIDEIENDISNGISFIELANKYNLKTNYVENYKLNLNADEKDHQIYKKIFNLNEEEKIGLLDENDFYILYQVEKYEKVLPKNNDVEFEKKIRKLLVNKSKYDFNSSLIKKISEKKFTQGDFLDLASSNSTSIENNEILSIEDNSKFTKDSIKLIYSLPSNNFALITDNNNNIYLSKIKNIYEKEISNSSKDFLKYNNQSNNKIIDQMYLSYDLLLNTKYNVKINEKTLERVKNYFR
tara:strand:+ start:136 stop:1578 length:1443 start_codon:yes stop_codon:yes gene_type:complete